MPQKHKYKESVVKNGYTVINCEDCGYWHVHPMPSEDELKIYYRITLFFWVRSGSIKKVAFFEILEQIQDTSLTDGMLLC